MRRFAKLVPVLVLCGSVAALRADTGGTNGNGTGSGTGKAENPVVVENLSVADMQGRAAAIKSEIAENAHHVTILKDQAKKQQDVIKLSCVNDKIVQLNAQQNIADNVADQLQAALDKNSDERHSEFARLSAAGEAVKRLREEAGSCVGETELNKQESGIDSTHPLFPDDPTQGNPFGVGIEPPAYCSPFD